MSADELPDKYVEAVLKDIIKKFEVLLEWQDKIRQQLDGLLQDMREFRQQNQLEHERQMNMLRAIG